MRSGTVIWFPVRLYDHCIAEADRLYRLETGGALMGYWYEPGTAVITTAIGPGPRAMHKPHAFKPDQDWQVAEIARHYEASGRRETYLGDWHTHPDAKAGYLSRTDRAVLRRVIKTTAARVQNPLMLIFHGAEGEWQAMAWVASLKPRSIIWPKLLLDEATLRLYESSARR